MRPVPFISILGPNPMVVLNSLDLLQETFLKKAVAFSDRPALVSSGYFLCVQPCRARVCECNHFKSPLQPCGQP